jgi:hypothetical protein
MKHSIFRSWFVKLLAASAIAIGVGLGAGAWLLARLEEKLSALRFEQPEIDLRQSPALEGDPIDAITYLHNYGKVPIRITNLASS